MSRLLRALPLALVVVAVPAAVAHAAPAPAEVVPGEVVVRFAPDTSPGMRAQALDTVDADGSQATPLPSTRLVTLDDDADVQAAAATLERRSDVLWAEPNYVWHADHVPNDPAFGELYGLVNTGQVVQQTPAPGSLTPQAGTPGVDTNVLPVWDVTTGSKAIRIGVADTGINHHVDLDANLDVAASRDFIAGEGQVGDPLADPDSHGTHVAGTIGAVGDNGIGVAGALWNADLVALRVLDAGGGTSLSIAAAFAYAGQAGLPIVNASLGGGTPSQAVQDAIGLASNTLFIVAAGNETTDVDATPSYPCAYPAANIVCVASIDNNANLSWYSNYGLTQVDLGAPGNQIYSTVPQYDETTIPVDASWTPEPGTWSFTAGSPSYWSDDLHTGVESEDALTVAGSLDLTGRAGCSVAFTWKGQFDEKGGLIFERSVGAGWERIGAVGNDRLVNTESRYGLKADGQSDVRLRITLVGDDDNTGGGAQVNRLTYRCVRPGSSTLYTRLSGTSMATPQVAGVAGLLLSAHPELTTAQLRTALVSTTTPTASLAGKTVTGGRVDAAAALASITSAPPAPSGGGGGGTTTTPAPVPTPTPDPIPVPVPTQPAATPVTTPPAAAPRATLQTQASSLRSRGVLTLRTAVSARATVRAQATLRWRGGHLTLTAPVRRNLRTGQIATLHLRATAQQRRALRSAGRVRARIVLTVTGQDGRTRHVVRYLTIG